ncbi:uncharacterized protein EAE98_010916 [Botrytis deweyae]|uniref:Uncharacterized protein n=1 Tax=Botrytis deweyae TaxID=2478750 RepID=A0ABQ7I777_9HELO|nr:uncharacterized protein EAE98_010916 [Botrytis deweyae]KAF7915836.1 hypothetical protein EAE98_010916 [Botrytis deweyae]
MLLPQEQTFLQVENRQLKRKRSQNEATIPSIIPFEKRLRSSTSRPHTEDTICENTAIGRRRNPLPLPSRASPDRSLTPPPPHASPDRSPTPPPSADHKPSGRRETLLLYGASEDQPLIVD